MAQRNNQKGFENSYRGYRTLAKSLSMSVKILLCPVVTPTVIGCIRHCTNNPYMRNLLRGITYSYNRNIGWQDRTIRSLLGLGAFAAAIYFTNSSQVLGVALSCLGMAQLGTVFSFCAGLSF